MTFTSPDVGQGILSFTCLAVRPCVHVPFLDDISETGLFHVAQTHHLPRVDVPFGGYDL